MIKLSHCSECRKIKPLAEFVIVDWVSWRSSTNPFEQVKRELETTPVMICRECVTAAIDGADYSLEDLGDPDMYLQVDADRIYKGLAK